MRITVPVKLEEQLGSPALHEMNSTTSRRGWCPTSKACRRASRSCASVYPPDFEHLKALQSLAVAEKGQEKSCVALCELSFTGPELFGSLAMEVQSPSQPLRPLKAHKALRT